MGINRALYNGVSGLNSFSNAISVVSDNISNANTTAYKSNSIHFGDLVNTYYSVFSNDTESKGAGSSVLGFSTDFSQGNFLSTASWSDLAISGDGFFNVVDPVGAKTYYTRDGSFHMDGQNFLVNAQGYRVQGDAGDIQIANPGNFVNISVKTDGKIVGIDAAGVETTISTLSLANFSNKGGLIRQGGNLYITGPEVGLVYDNVNNPDMFGKVIDFTLEGSNVDMAKEMVDMIIFQASYNANSKTITTSKDMLDTTINMVR